jgi:DNA-binding transcriptional LysR family regulator
MTMAIPLVPRSLRYVEEVARQGSIQAASRELGIAASAIDRQILLLEDELGAPLFERQPTGMRPTPVGGLIISLSQRWKTDAGNLVAAVRQMKGVDLGHVRLAAMDSHANGLLPSVIRTLASRHPRIALEVEIVSTDAAVSLLMEDRVDLVAAFNVKPRREVHILWSTELPLGCAVAPDHPLAKHASLRLKDVVAYPLASQSRSLAIRRYMDDRHAWMFSEKDAPIVTNSLQLMKRLAVSGSHVAITSELDTAPELIAGELRFLPIEDETARPQTIAVAISARRPLMRTGQIVADLIREEVLETLGRVRALAESRPLS